jgi:hypothetical protein
VTCRPIVASSDDFRDSRLSSLHRQHHRRSLLHQVRRRAREARAGSSSGQRPDRPATAAGLTRTAGPTRTAGLTRTAGPTRTAGLSTAAGVSTAAVADSSMGAAAPAAPGGPQTLHRARCGDLHCDPAVPVGGCRDGHLAGCEWKQRSPRRSHPIYYHHSRPERELGDAVAMMTAANRRTLGWRALAGLVCSGAVAGFAVPVAAISLARHGRQQPTVRLLPAPPIPKTTTQPALRYTGPVRRLLTPVEPHAIRRLTRRQPERNTRALRTHIVPLPKIASQRRRRGSVKAPLPPHKSAPSPNNGSKPQPPTPVTAQGGAQAP